MMCDYHVHLHLSATVGSELVSFWRVSQSLGQHLPSLDDIQQYSSIEHSVLGNTRGGIVALTAI
jgi:hypothetical protein